MAIGPGKYDDLCTLVREELKKRGIVAHAVMLIVTGSHPSESGFSIQATLPQTLLLPKMLRYMATSIESDHKEGKL